MKYGKLIQTALKLALKAMCTERYGNRHLSFPPFYATLPELVEWNGFVIHRSNPVARSNRVGGRFYYK